MYWSFLCLGRSSCLGKRETSLGRLPLPIYWGTLSPFRTTRFTDSRQLKGSLLQGSCLLTSRGLLSLQGLALPESPSYLFPPTELKRGRHPACISFSPSWSWSADHERQSPNSELDVLLIQRACLGKSKPHDSLKKDFLEKSVASSPSALTISGVTVVGGWGRGKLNGSVSNKAMGDTDADWERSWESLFCMEPSCQWRLSWGWQVACGFIYCCSLIRIEPGYSNSLSHWRAFGFLTFGIFAGAQYMPLLYLKYPLPQV